MGARVAQVLIMTAVLIAMGAVAVWAQSSSASGTATPSAVESSSRTSYKQCFSDPCHGNARNEVIYERIGDRRATAYSATAATTASTPTPTPRTATSSTATVGAQTTSTSTTATPTTGSAPGLATTSATLTPP
jgi:hypothetical protein